MLRQPVCVGLLAGITATNSKDARQLINQAILGSAPLDLAFRSKFVLLFADAS